MGKSIERRNRFSRFFEIAFDDNHLPRPPPPTPCPPPPPLSLGAFIALITSQRGHDSA